MRKFLKALRNGYKDLFFKKFYYSEQINPKKCQHRWVKVANGPNHKVCKICEIYEYTGSNGRPVYSQTIYYDRDVINTDERRALQEHFDVTYICRQPNHGE